MARLEYYAVETAEDALSGAWAPPAPATPPSPSLDIADLFASGCDQPASTWPVEAPTEPVAKTFVTMTGLAAAPHLA